MMLININVVSYKIKRRNSSPNWWLLRRVQINLNKKPLEEEVILLSERLAFLEKARRAAESKRNKLATKIVKKMDDHLRR